MDLLPPCADPNATPGVCRVPVGEAGGPPYAVALSVELVGGIAGFTLLCLLLGYVLDKCQKRREDAQRLEDSINGQAIELAALDREAARNEREWNWNLDGDDINQTGERNQPTPSFSGRAPGTDWSYIDLEAGPTYPPTAIVPARSVPHPRALRSVPREPLPSWHFPSIHAAQAEGAHPPPPQYQDDYDHNVEGAEWI